MQDKSPNFVDTEESVIDRRLLELSRQLEMLEETVNSFSSKLNAVLGPVYPKVPADAVGEMPKQQLSPLTNRLERFADAVEAQRYKLNELCGRLEL